MKQWLRHNLVLYSKGFCMGIADLIPGISGGTIALIVGIYEELVDAIYSFDAKFFSLIVRFKFKEAFSNVNWRFLGVVLLGIGTAIFTLSGIVKWMLHEHPVFLNAFFFGLILASIPLIAQRIKQWPRQLLMSVTIAAIVMYFIAGLIPVITPTNSLFLFVCGAVAICAMILPGISGSFILLLLGKYQFIIEAIHDRNIMVLGIFASGCVVGLLSFVRLLKMLLHKHHDLTISVLIGLVIGSLRKIWPWKFRIETVMDSNGKIISVQETNIFPQGFGGEVVFSLVLIAVGFAAAYALKRLAAEK